MKWKNFAYSFESNDGNIEYAIIANGKIDVLKRMILKALNVKPVNLKQKTIYKKRFYQICMIYL